MNLTPWAWLILPLAVCRGHQLVLWDRVFATPRGWLLGKLNPQGLPMEDPDRPYLSYVLECPWCMSIWVAALAVALCCWDFTRQATLAVALVLALSLVAVVLDRMVDKWFPDQPHTSATLEGYTAEGQALEVTAPPGHVAEAFEQLAGDDAAGSE